MKQFLILLLMIGTFYVRSSAQVSINTDNSAPDNSAMLDVKSNTKGILIPRMTQTEILAISNPSNGLLVFCTTDNKFYTYVAYVSMWKELLYGPSTIPFTCGSYILINHVAGNVAPVTKTVSYGTVTNIPGENAKCWITSNLGADHQATAVNDATEASAGWYWQFNQKQGYKHDGTNRTPNTIWITSINENSDWTTASDPCNIELGTTWRIPTYTEWYNVDNTGGWTNWNGPWGSGLKLHASGYLDPTNGSLGGRGGTGNYYSSTQNITTIGWRFHFSSTISQLFNDNGKSFGCSLRCIKD
jgi:hypothetical protein